MVEPLFFDYPSADRKWENWSWIFSCHSQIFDQAGTRDLKISFSFMARTHPQSLRQETSGRLRGPFFCLEKSGLATWKSGAISKVSTRPRSGTWSSFFRSRVLTPGLPSKYSPGPMLLHFSTAQLTWPSSLTEIRAGTIVVTAFFVAVMQQLLSEQKCLKIFFGSTSEPLASTRWIRLTFSRKLTIEKQERSNCYETF